MIAAALTKQKNIQVTVREVPSDGPIWKDSEPTGRFEHSKIAIVGYSGRFPSAASNEAFWELLRAGRDVHREIPRDRFDWETYYDPTGKRRNTSRVKYGCWIDEPGLFDTKFFNMSPKEAENTDPAQRLAITTTYEAMEMAGMVRNRTPSTQQDRVGVFFGTTSDDWREVNSGQDVGTYFIPGGNRAFVPGRIRNCNAFDDEASGYCRSDAVGSVILKRLEDAEADNDPIFAVIVGTNTNHCGQTDSITRPHEGDQVSVFKRIVRHSGIDPLDISYVEMHGTGTQAGDATEMNSVLSVFVPEYKRMQMTPARPLYLGSAKANIGHAESASGVSSLIKVMLMMKHGEIPPHCGIKNRINHNYPLDLEQRGVRIALNVAPWKRDALPSGKRSVFLNNFSAAGGNTAMLVEDAPIRRRAVDKTDARVFHPVAVSAKSPKSLVGNINALIAFIDRKRGSLPVGPLSYTTTARRMHHTYRAMVTGTDLSSILVELKSLASDTEASLADMKPIPAGAKKQTRVIFMFSGQGVLYSELAKSLFTVNPAFRSTVFELNRLSRLLGFPSFVEIIDGTTTAAALPSVSAVVSHLALVCVQIALFELWKTWGVTPAAVIGHSLGEYPALYAAGVLSAADVIYLIGTRATLLESLCTSGTHSMLAIKASWEIVERLMVEHTTSGSCELACINQPSGHVIAGPRDSITELSRQAQQIGIETVQLAVPFAFHSAQVEPILTDFEASACHVTFHPPTIPFLSPLLGRAISVGDIGALASTYVSAACRGTVNFVKAVGVAADVVNIQDTIWLEIGAHPLCSGMVKGTLGPQIRTIATLRQNVEPYKTIVSGLQTLYLAGVEINWNEYHRHFPSSQTVIELPLYSWDLKNYWIQYRNDFLLTKGEQPLPVAPPSRPLRKHLSPTAQCIVEESHGTEKSSMVVESDIFDEKLLPILQGHLVNGAALAPSSMYADLALTVAVYLISQSPNKLLVDTTGLDVANVRVDNPLIAQSHETSHLFRMSATADWPSNAISMRIFSVDLTGKRTVSHARVEVRVVPGQRWLAEWKRNTHLITARIDALAAAVHDPNSETHLVKRGMAYKLFAAIVQYKTEYQGMSEIILDSHRLEAVSTVEFQVGKEEFYLNPRWIDSLGGIAGFIMNANDGVDSRDQVFINHGWERMRIAEPLQQNRTYRAYNRMQLVENTTYAGDTYILYDGRIVAIFEGVTFQGVPRRVLDHLLPSSGAKKAGLTKKQRTPVPMDPTPSMPPAQRDGRPVPKSSSHSPSSSGVFGRILDLISEEVGIAPSELKADTEFAALGVDSLLTLTITAKIREELGLDFPSSLFVDQATVGELQVLVGGRSNEGETSATISSGSSSDDMRDSQVTSSATSVYPDTPLTEGPSCPDRTRASIVLRQIISEETQVPIDELKPSTGLTDIGIDSLLGLTISGKVQELLGVDIAGNTVMSFDTIQDLEDEIYSEVGFAKPKTITPWSGDQAASRSTGPSPASSVPRTCSALGGWSAGGILAVEAIRQVHAQGLTQISYLVLLDSPNPIGLQNPPKRMYDFFDSLGIFGGSPATPDCKVKPKTPEWLLQHFDAFIRVLDAYEPTPLDNAPASLIVYARDGVCKDPNGPKMEIRPDDPREMLWLINNRTDFSADGWASILGRQQLRVEVLDEVNHFTLMDRGPAMEKMGNILAKFFNHK
ncbi:hypothetical protein ATERTT37_003160 [Aspergillus terreus]